MLAWYADQDIYCILSNCSFVKDPMNCIEPCKLLYLCICKFLHICGQHKGINMVQYKFCLLWMLVAHLCTWWSAEREDKADWHITDLCPPLPSEMWDGCWIRKMPVPWNDSFTVTNLGLLSCVIYSHCCEQARTQLQRTYNTISRILLTKLIFYVGFKSLS